MKTIHKKTPKKEDQALYEVKKLLVEDPYGHHLLLAQAAQPRSSDVSELIEIKKAKDKKMHAAKLLVSSISLCLSFLIVIGMFEWKSVERGSEINLELNKQNFEDLIDVPQTKQIQKPPVQAQAPTIIEVSDEEIIEDIEINLDIEMTEDTRIEEVVFLTDNNEVLPEENADEIFVIVEEQPMPKGGIKAFYNYISANLEYPASARRMGIDGRVFIEFVVEKDGSLSNIKVAKGIGAGCNEEAMRVISQAPNWNPGKQRGRAVRVRMVMPIVFRLM